MYVRRDSARGRKRFLFVFNPLFFLTIGHYTERIREKKKRNEADGSDVTSFRRAVRTSQKTQGEADIPEEAEQGGKKTAAPALTGSEMQIFIGRERGRGCQSTDCNGFDSSLLHHPHRITFSLRFL